jgi:hypothetical protein
VKCWLAVSAAIRASLGWLLERQFAVPGYRFAAKAIGQPLKARLRATGTLIDSHRLRDLREGGVTFWSYNIEYPPSIRQTAPVMYEEASEAR